MSATKIADSYLANLQEQLSEEDGKFLSQIEGPEALMAYVARVSSPKQTNPSFARLLAYCAEHQHWSVFEMADATFEIQTSRAIAQQILRHRSFCFQEFSQRYAKVTAGTEIYEARRQDHKNRQNSIADMTPEDQKWFTAAQEQVRDANFELYNEALEKGIAKEQARFLLPLGTVTKMYMKGSLRSWIHYVNLRAAHGTQKEHMDIAKAIKVALVKEFPIVSEAVGWADDVRAAQNE